MIGRKQRPASANPPSTMIAASPASRLASRPFVPARLAARSRTLAAMAAKKVLVPVGNGSEEMEAVSAKLKAVEAFASAESLAAWWR